MTTRNSSLDYPHMSKFREFRMKRKYEVLLASFFILIFGDILSTENYDIMPVLVFQNVVASLVLFYGKKKWRLPLKILLATIIIVEILSITLNLNYIRSSIGMVYIVYFFFLAIELFRQIWQTKEVNSEMVSAVLCGFIVLGISGAYLFAFVEVLHAGSFANLSRGVHMFKELIYFSFISILSIGYGDIYPITTLARKATLFIGILGHFYNVIVFGIVIGKYIAKK